MEPTIIFEDSDFLVIEKPAGFIVNKADTSVGQKTIQEWADKYLKLSENSPIDTNGDFFKRSGIVHRLDKETSGLLLLAKSKGAFEELQRQFKQGEVEKEYIALAHGTVKPEEGEINVPIGRLPWNRMRFGIIPQGRESRTLYKVLSNHKLKQQSRVDAFSLVEVYPKSGRTHQIRVHFQYIGNPLFADALYAGRKTIKRDRKILSRHFLHAGKILFNHPTSGIRLKFESPLPQDLKDLISKLSV